MALAKLKEKRMSERRMLTGLLPGRLITVDGRDVICQPRDVSEHGFGMTSPEILPVGGILTLKCRNKNIVLEVAWMQPGFGKRDMYRYGLVTKDPAVNLEEVFIAAGCLR